MFISGSVLIAGRLTTCCQKVPPIITYKINEVRNGPSICIDPHAKLKQGVVFDKGCYAHLRSASRYLLEKSPSSLEDSGDSKTHLDSGLREHLIYEKSIIETLLDEHGGGKLDTIQSIKNACVSKQPGSSVINISTRYLSEVSAVNPEWSGDILLKCQDEIIKSSNGLINIKEELIAFTLKKRQGLCYQRSLNIDDVEVDRYTLNAIFKSFEKVFNENKTTDRFLVAIIASRLRDYWCSNLSGNIRKNDVNKCTTQYANLFIAGDILANLLAGDDVKVKADKKLSFMHKFDGAHFE